MAGKLYNASAGLNKAHTLMLIIMPREDWDSGRRNYAFFEGRLCRFCML